MTDNLNHLSKSIMPSLRIALPIRGGLAFYLIDCILYFRSDGNYTYLRPIGSIKEIFISTSMAKLEAVLSTHFIRSHNQYLVNCMHIERMLRMNDKVEFVLTGEVKIPISRNGRKAVEARMSKYMVV